MMKSQNSNSTVKKEQKWKFEVYFLRLPWSVQVFKIGIRIQETNGHPISDPLFQVIGLMRSDSYRMAHNRTLISL